MKKKLASVLLSILVIVQMLPLFALAEETETPIQSGITLDLPEDIAEQNEPNSDEAKTSEGEQEPVPYLFYDETAKVFRNTKLTDSYTPVISTSGTTAWTTDWYVADGISTILETVTVNGDVALILKDDCELTVTEGIVVPSDSSLTILAQSDGENMGRLITTGSGGAPGIGGDGTVTIHGGIINASGGTEEDFFGGAGIGGRGHILNLYDDYEYSETEEIVFTNPGTAGTVCIFGGDITAIGGYHSAGIGGGYGCDGGNISIYGGNVTATGQDGAPGVGCGMADCLDMTGDTVTVPVEGGTVMIDDADVVSNGEEICHKHDYTNSIYLDNNDGTHSRKCQYCDSLLTEPHTFVNGKCDFCGLAEFIIDKNGVLTKYWGNAAVGVIPDNVTKIGQRAFASGQKITEVTIPASVEVIDTQAFYRCGNLTTVIFDGTSSLTTIGQDAFAGCGLTSFTVPASVETIGDSSFEGMKSLTQLTFEEGSKLETIGSYAFSSDGLTTVRIPRSVRSIGTFAFDNMSFDSVYVSWTEKEKMAFLERDFTTPTYNDGTLYVPEGSTALYKDHEIWGKFKTIEEYHDHDHDFTGDFADNGDGMHSRKCVICGLHDSQTQPHVCDTGVYRDNEDGTHSQQCSLCGAYGGEEDHAGTTAVDNGDGTHTLYCECCLHDVKPIWHTFTNGKCLCGAEDAAQYPYLDYDEAGDTLETEYCGSYTLVNGNVTEWRNGKWYVARETCEIGGKVIINGDVHLIIADDKTVTAAKGIAGTGHLYIHAMSTGDTAGKLVCIGETDADAINVTKLTVNGAAVVANGGVGHSGNPGENAPELPGGDFIRRGSVGDNGGTGCNAITAEELAVNGAVVTVSGGAGGIGGKGGNGLGGSNGGFGGRGGIAIKAAIVTAYHAVITASGGKGGNGGDGSNGVVFDGIEYKGGMGGASGNGGIAVSDIQRLTVYDSTVSATGGDSGIGGKGGHVDGSDGPIFSAGVSVVLGEGGVIDGLVQVKANEADAFIPLPGGESVSDYRYAKITEAITPTSPVTLNKTSIRIDGEKSGLRFAAYVTDAQRAACDSYGFLVARENDTLKDDPTKLVFNDMNSASGTNDHGVTYTSGVAYDKANGIDKTYADDGTEFGLDDVEATFFTGVMQGIPKAFYAENLIARPYIVIDGVTIYGETYAKSLYTNACAIRDGGYQGLDEDGIRYINSIISAVDDEAEIDVGGLTE